MKEEKPEEAEADVSEEDERKSSRTFLFVIALIVLIFAVFLILRIYSKPESRETNPAYMYNGFSFVNIGGTWFVKVQKKGTNTVFDVPLHYGAYDVINVTKTGSIDDRFEQSRVYITFDPDEPDLTYVALSAGELSLNIAQAMDVTPISACTKNITLSCKDRPIVTCESTNESVIYLKQSDETSLNLKGNCVVVSGRGKELVRAADKLILGLYGILRD